MQDVFDPYRKWLGIRATERPLNHYQLLGLEPFEDDTETISNAADQRIAFVRTLSLSDYADLTQRVLNELAAAKVCLLSRDLKGAYDRLLRARVETMKSVAVPPPPPPILPVLQVRVPASLPPVVAAANTPSTTPFVPAPPNLSMGRRWRLTASLRRNALVVRAAVVMLGFVLVLAQIWWRQRDFGTATLPTQMNNGDGITPSTLPEVGNERPRRVVGGNSNQPIGPQGEPARPKETEPNPGSSESVSVENPATGTINVDLLARIDPAKDFVRGICSRVGDSLDASGEVFRANFRFVLPNAYMLEIVVTPLDDDEVNSLAAYLYSGETEFIAVLSKDNTCLIPVDGEDPRAQGRAKKGAVFKNGRPNTIVYTVWDDRLDVKVDGETALEWNDFSRLKRRDRDQLFALEGAGGSFRFERITVQPLVARSRVTPPIAIVPFSAENANQHQEAWAKYLNTDVVTENKIGMKLVLIPPGKFMMGTANGGGGNEKPAHEVTLNKPFYLGEGEVTVEQYGRFIDDAAYPPGEKPEQWPGAISPMPDCPVNNVNWFDAILFCNWLSAKEGCKPAYERTGEKMEIDNTVRDVWRCDFASDGYRLPSEAEWEYACRAGSSDMFCFGNDEAELPRYGSFAGNANRRIWPAGTRLANAWGLFDMHGNVWEWCWDWHGEYGAGSVGPVAGSCRVLRGGAFDNHASDCRSAFRGEGCQPVFRFGVFGFRVLAAHTNVPTPPSSEVPSDQNDPIAMEYRLLADAVAWYRAESNAIDSAGGHNGTLQGGASYTLGSVNRSFQLDGASGYVQVPDNPVWDFGSNELTIDVWINFTSIRNGSLPAIVAQDEGGGGTNKWIYGYDGTSFFLHINDPVNGAIWLRSAPFALNMNQWYNVALSRNGTTFTFFANGVAIGADTSSRDFPAVSAPLAIGFSEGLEYLHGLIDDAVLFDRALSESEIETIYRGASNGKVMPVPPLRRPKEQ